MSSSVIKHVPSEGTVENTQQDQSGWTTYLEDFSLDDDQRDQQSLGPSLVSDAANYKIISDKNQVIARSSLDPSEFPKRLNFNNKPTRRKMISYNDDLEDTASSPVNSPKLSSVKQMEINLRRPDVSSGDFVGKDAGGSYPFSGMQPSEKGNIKYDGKTNNNDSTSELRKRGLCLVPLSMLMNNYLH